MLSPMKLRSEYVVAVVGKVEKRAGATNENLKTGDIEVIAEQVRILSESETPPFPIEENSKTKEELRLKYRYLDLRRPDLQDTASVAQIHENNAAFITLFCNPAHDSYCLTDVFCCYFGTSMGSFQPFHWFSHFSFLLLLLNHSNQALFLHLISHALVLSLLIYVS